MFLVVARINVSGKEKNHKFYQQRCAAVSILL